jgi:hypothetical protein
MPTAAATNPYLTWGFNNYGDQDGDTSFEWECLTDELTTLMKKLNKGGKWYCEVENFGWQKRSGHKAFKAETGQKLLGAVLPNTDNSFKVFIMGKGFGRTIKIQNWHHDSPLGDEYYLIRRWKDGDPAPW